MLNTVVVRQKSVTIFMIFNSVSWKRIINKKYMLHVSIPYNIIMMYLFMYE